MLRVLFTIVWLLLSAWLAIWVGEGLFGIDQRQSILPFMGGDTLMAPILVGVAWGLLLTFGSTLGSLGRRSTPRGDVQIGVGRVVEVAQTGLTVNDVPQFDIFVRVTASDGTESIGQMRTLLDAGDQATIRTGLPLPVRFSTDDPDVVALADTSEPTVREALLDWRIQRGLIDPRQVRARTTGNKVPASVLSVRPTGRRREGQSELELRVLMAPEGAASWEADTVVFLYPEAISHVQVGSPVWAYYRREDPQTVAITLDEAEGR